MFSGKHVPGRRFGTGSPRRFGEMNACVMSSGTPFPPGFGLIKTPRPAGSYATTNASRKETVVPATHVEHAHGVGKRLIGKVDKEG
jgi:hypothetical protein